MNNRWRLIACLLVTAIILASGPFLWGGLATAEAEFTPIVSEEAPQPVVSATPVHEGSSNILDPSPQYIPEPVYLTARPRYVERLVEKESVNLLICAPDTTSWSMDTIMIASISKASGRLSLISLPRDIYIEYSENLRDQVEQVEAGFIDLPGMSKINAAHVIGDKLKYLEGKGRFDRPYVEFLADVIGEVFDLHIDDYIYMQTRGFRRIVDYFGGVTVNVPIRMFYEDPTQDLYIDLQPGIQTLDGIQAEGFVRFRQGFSEEGTLHNYGDWFRKKNQGMFVKAFLQQHLTLRNLARLGDISEFVGQQIITSIKDWNTIVSYGAMAEKVLAVENGIEARTVKATDGRIGGLSYVLLEERKEPIFDRKLIP